jgi:zinc and cadmium transporter
MTVLLAAFLLFVISIFGGALSFFISHEKQKLVNSVLIITGAYLLSLAVLHLLPHVAAQYQSQGLALVLLGFVLQFILQQFSHGVEHGHSHAHHSMPMKEFMVIGFGLSIHALTEGIPLIGAEVDKNTFLSFLIGISIHKFPEAFALACLASHTFKTPIKRGLVILIFGALTPLAMLFFAQTGWITSAVFAILFPMVTGAVLQIATSIIAETTSNNHQLKFIKLVLLLTGFGLGLVSLLIH